MLNDSPEYNKISVLADGINSQLADIDFFDMTTKAIEKNGFNYDFSLPYYFKRNSYLEKVIFWASQNIREGYFDFLR